MSDLISRLSEIRSQYNCFDENEEPYYRALSEVIKMLSEQADGDTISRQDVLDAIKEWRVVYDEDTDLIDMIKHLPSAQPERKKGEWILINNNNGQHSICSKCGEWKYRQNQQFCGECGADMRGEEE